MNDEHEDMDRLIDKTLGGRFQIKGLLGKGGMGVVFRAFDLELGRSVAIKMIRAELARQPDFQKGLHEAKIGAKFTHSNIVQIHDFRWDDEYPYIVMELIPGDNLFKIMQSMQHKQKWLSISETLQLMIEISLTLGLVHQQGVYHLDMKPENILFKPEPTHVLRCRPVIADLGLAWYDEKRGAVHLGAIRGTPVYMSPEQALGKRVDARSDVYALGVLLYELLTGRQPFNIPGDSFDEVVSFHKQYDSENKPAPRPTPLKSLPNITDIVNKALAKKPNQRFQDANQLAEELRVALEQLPVTVKNLTIAQAAMQGVTSLFEQYQETLEHISSTSTEANESPAKKRETLPEGEYRPSPATKYEGYVEVLTSDGSLVRTVPLTGDRIIIGRTQGENMIMLDHPNVSREHAQLELDHNEYYITDLGSANGTYLDNHPLLPLKRARWRPAEEIRLAIFRLRLMRTEQHVITQPKPEPRLEVEPERVELSVELDQSVSYSITLTNHGKSVDHYIVSINGRPAEWVDQVIVSLQKDRQSPETTRHLPVEVELKSGDKGTVKISFHLPASPQIQAEDYPFTTRFTLQKDPSEFTEVDGTLTVKPFRVLQMKLDPKVQKGVLEGKFELHLHNQSNVALPLQLEAQDDLDDLVRCRYHFSPGSITIPPDQETTVQLDVVPEMKYINEPEVSHQFTVMAKHRELLEVTFKEKGEWKQIRPSFEMELIPIAREHVIEGSFLVNIQSQVNYNIEVQLEAIHASNFRSFFDRNQVKLPTGKTETVNLSLRAGPLPGDHDIQHDFTVRAWPIDKPREYLQEDNKWVQVPPDFELILDPKIIEDEIAADFELKIRNNSSAQLNMKLDAQPLDESFELTLPSEVLIVSPGEMPSIHLQTKAPPVRGEEDKTHCFSITARANQAPQVIHKTQGQWIQHPPRYTLRLEEERHTNITEGQFVLWISNESKVDLTMQLEVVETLKGCRYTFDHSLVQVPAHQNYRGLLTVLPDMPLIKKKSRTYPFTIIAKPKDSPGAIQQIQAIWVQTPVDFSLDLRPEKNQDSKIGKFTIIVSNQGDTDLFLHLKATDREGICTYMFNLTNTLSTEDHSDVDIVIELDNADRQRDDTFAVNSAEIALRAHETRYIMLEAIAPSLTPERRYLPFTITAHPSQLPKASQHINSSWEHIPPMVDLNLSPGKFVSADKGVFQIRLRNRNDMDLNLQLSAIKSETQCRYVFDQSRLHIPAGGLATTRLEVQCAQLPGITLFRNHYFSVIASLSEHPSITYQKSGVWRQVRPGWIYIVIAILVLSGVIYLFTILLIIIRVWFQ